MTKESKKRQREAIAAAQEAARVARHNKRFGEDGAKMRAHKKALAQFVERAEAEVAKKKKRFTQKGYQDLRASAAATVAAQLGLPVEETLKKLGLSSGSL